MKGSYQCFAKHATQKQPILNFVLHPVLLHLITKATQRERLRLTYATVVRQPLYHLEIGHVKAAKIKNKI